MSIQDYIQPSRYPYRIKTTFPLNDHELDLIESVLAKYDPLNISNVKKTIFQAHPLDFYEVENTEIFMVDVQLGLPVSPSVLQIELVNRLKVASKFIVVRGENDPNEQQDERKIALASLSSDAKKKGLTPEALLNNNTNAEYEQTDGRNYYGDDYNTNFLHYLKTNEKPPKEKNPLFGWMQNHKTDDRFNQDVEGSPRIDGEKKKIEPPPQPTYRKLYRDQKGKEQILKVKSDLPRRGK